MNEILKYSVIFLLSVFISSLSQILLKSSALKTHESRIKEYLNPRVIIAYTLFFLSTFITMYAYKYVPLSMGPVLESTGYIFVTIFGVLILKEKINKRKLIGISSIFIGILVFSL